MEIGIAKERFTKKIRLTLYIVPLLILLAISPIFFNTMHTLVIVAFFFLTISLFIFIDKVVDSFLIVGKVIIEDQEFVFHQNDNSVAIPFKDIKIIILNPVLGISRIPSTFKTYHIALTTHGKTLIQCQVTREEIVNGKLLRKNIVHSNRFDLIEFLKSKNIPFQLGDRQ